MSNQVTPNPVTTPGFPPVAPLPPRRHRSMAGPFVLIVLGTVCLLGTMHVLALGRLAHLFANYWPVLLIFWGVIKLIEHQRAQREGTRAAGIGAGGIFLVVMIVVFGLIATQLERVNWSGIRDNINIDDSDFSDIFGQNYSFNDHLERDFPAGASLKIIDTRGAVSVHASDDNKITVAVRKRIGAENQGDADKYNNETKPTITTIGGLVTLDAKSEGAGDHPVETDLDISLPRKVAVSIISKRGDVNLVGRDGGVDISAQHSDTTVEDVNGNVKVSQEKGSVKIEQIAGDVHVEGRVNEVSVADVKGAVQLDGEFQESVKLARIAKTVTFKSSRTDMEFSRIEGSLDLDSDDLHAEQITGPLHLTTRSKNIRLEQVSGDVRLQDDNGAIEVGMRTLGNVQIDSRNGDIQLSVPDKAGFRLDARTRDGEIQSDFTELKVDNGEHEAKASGSVGNATSHIVLNNEHDGIEIRRASSQPPKPPEPPSPKAGKALPAPKVKVEPTEN
jgi:putative adhesin/cell wall-active antibiotic response 4TMS protein YvqF